MGKKAGGRVTHNDGYVPTDKGSSGVGQKKAGYQPPTYESKPSNPPKKTR